MVRGIRNIEQSMGSEEKEPVPREKKMRIYARKSLISVRQIPKDTEITAKDISILRPGNGIEPKFFDDVIGCRSKVDIEQGEQIKWQMLYRR
jgi:sialic acid synthase SpsE